MTLPGHDRAHDLSLICVVVHMVIASEEHNEACLR